MLFYIFIFISSVILISVVNAMVHHIVSGRKFNTEYASQVDYGRALNFKTKKSEFQEKPVFSH